MKSQKEILRKHYLGLRKSEDFGGRQKLLEQQLLGWNFPEPVTTLALYRAQSGEADPILWAQKFPAAFPRVQGKELQFHLAHPFQADLFEEGPWKIWEPKSELPIIPASKLSHCVVPLVAFDERGIRLGRGGGFYDRFLNHFTGVKIGLAFEWQKHFEALPAEPHDQKLDLVITEKTVYLF